MSKTFYPVVVSASRATDIPAYYGEWFLNRLRAGFCEWTNPFNRELSRVSFAKTRAMVFWTKNALPFMSRLDMLDSFEKGYYFSYTINDYVKEKWEPGLPSLDERIANFIALSRRLGNERVVWRVDPLILSRSMDVDELARRVAVIGRRLAGHCRSLITSFVDINNYQKVKRNICKIPDEIREPDDGEKDFLIKTLSSLCAGWGMKLAVCSENGDWSKYGVENASCVDGLLLRKLYPRDSELIEYLSPPRARDIFTGEYDSVNKILKDRGQRKDCGCIMSKDVGAYDTCPAGCVYCYANSTKMKVENNFERHDPEAATLN